MAAQRSMQHYQRIWKTVLAVPAGNVASYGQIADLAGLPGRARLVGKALGMAPKPMAVPWYRIVRSDGKIAFPVDSELASEQIGRLQEENVAVLGHRIKMAQFQWQPDLSEMLHRLEF